MGSYTAAVMNSLLLLLARDSTNVAQLERIYAASRRLPGFAGAVIGAMRQLDSDCAWRAVWLLKRLARDGEFGETDLCRLAACADELTDWAARLNLCQLFALTGCPRGARDELFPYFVECFRNSRVMIRAWAITVLFEFKDDPKYAAEVAAMLREARADSGSSMKARLRHLVKPARSRRHRKGQHPKQSWARSTAPVSSRKKKAASGVAAG